MTHRNSQLHRSQLYRPSTDDDVPDNSARQSPDRDLESSLRRIVRCVVRRGRGSTPLAKRILAIAQSSPRNSATNSAAGEERLVDSVSRRISQEITSRRSPASILGVRVLETVRQRQTDHAFVR